MTVQCVPSATAVLVGGGVLWLADYRSAPVGAAATGSRSAQQRLNFRPEPQGQGALRAGVGSRELSREAA